MFILKTGNPIQKTHLYFVTAIEDSSRSFHFLLGALSIFDKFIFFFGFLEHTTLGLLFLSGFEATP